MTKAEAIEVLDVFEQRACDGFAEDRDVVHSFAGSIGCDWDLFAVKEFISKANFVGEASPFMVRMNHGLLVKSGGRYIAFATKPEATPTTGETT